MEYMISIIWGVIVGFAIAVPVGPIGLICIQRTLANNRVSGLISGLGAATADALLASIGAFSISFIYTFINNNQSFLKIIGGSLIVFLGIMALISKTKNTQIKKSDSSLRHIEEYLSALVLTITNPLSTFILFLAFANISNKIGHSPTISMAFVIGVFLGSCAWWLLLTKLTDRLAHKISHEHILKINKWFAIIMIVLGIVTLLGVLFKQF